MNEEQYTYPVLFRCGPLQVAKESGTGRWAGQPRFFHGRWERVGGHCWKLLTKWLTLAVWWNWRERSRPYDI